MLSSVGLNILIGDTYLLPLTIFFLLVTLVSFAYRAQHRRGYVPLYVGSVASIIIVVGKFQFHSDHLAYVGAGLLLIGSVYNAWPKSKVAALTPQ